MKIVSRERRFSACAARSAAATDEALPATLVEALADHVAISINHDRSHPRIRSCDLSGALLRVPADASSISPDMPTTSLF